MLFIEDLSFIYYDYLNKGDFLIRVTVPIERKITLGYSKKFP